MPGVELFRIHRNVELAARGLVKRARFCVYDHRAFGSETGELRDVGVLLDIRRVGARAKYEAKIG